MYEKASFVEVFCLLFSIVWGVSVTQATSCYDHYEHYLFRYPRYCEYGCCGSYCCDGLSNGEIAGIVFGCAIAVGIIVTIVRACCYSQNQPGHVVNTETQPSVSVITTGGLQPHMGPVMQMQHPPPGYIPQAPGTSAGYPGYPDTKGPPLPY